MGFREMSAWGMAGLLSVLGLYYFKTVIAAGQAQGIAPAPDLRLISGVTIVLIAGAIVTHIVIAAMSPHDADSPEDERDRLVVSRAGNISGWVLGSGVFVGLWHFVFQGDGNVMFHILIASVIAAQITDYLLQIYFYRRGV